MRGRHFGFLGSLCAIWITARVGFLWGLPQSSGTIPQVESRAIVTATSRTIARGGNVGKYSQSETGCCPAGLFLHVGREGIKLRPPLVPTVVSTNPQEVYFNTEPSMPIANTSPLATDPHLPAAPQKPSTSSFGLYAYSFIRGEGSSGAPLGSGQYGGSQSGLIATYALSRFDADPKNTRLAILLRGAIAHDNPAEREVALGLRWHPVRQIPVSLSVERRFRHAREDAYSAYVAGGVSEQRLPLDFRLDAFGQAGFVGSRRGGLFFDASARADRHVASMGAVPISAGVGLWAGGQEDVFRVDAGPSITGKIPVADTQLRISADWRFRAAGDARPASGPALTLSTAF
jgi:hypothetical protein